eukprot:TCALIF_09393-PA protein Name:"Similar to mal3 Molybdenum cofactor sulfurase 3 (Aedes aegypti)" AED:0.06 eAED:0.06 QI:0/0/0/1/1/1/2/0/656
MNKILPMDIQNGIREDFPHLRGTTYLDQAGAGLYCHSQIENVSKELQTSLFANPHSDFRSKEAIDAVRTEVLDYFHTNNENYKLVFTSGATAGLKIIGHCFSFKPGHRNCFAYLTDNHTSVIGMRELFREKEPQITVRPLDSHDLIKGPVAQETFEKALLAFPAMSNFCGFKYPIESVLKLWGDTWTTILDASALVSTCELNLSQLKPDFVVLSFYKIFGYPTGLGALLVKSDVMDALHKTYFGGGTVEMHFTRSSIHVPRRSWVDYFEDGTLPYHQIMALRHGFSALKRHVPGGIKAVESHTFGLAQYLYQGLARILHENGNPVVEIYHSSNFISVKEQGGIVNFNLLQCDGKYFGFNVFHRLAKLEQVLVRVGCFCNVGACQKYLQFSDQTMMANYQKGHVCGDDIDLVNGHPTGSIRISFGYYSTTNDVDIVIDLVRNHFVQEDTLKTHYLSTQKAAKNDRSEQYEVCLGSVCGETMDGLDCGQDASEWLCKAFGESNLKLVQQLGRSSVSFNSMSLANEAPYLVVNKSSVDLLWKKLVEDDHLKTHDMTLEILQEQFRANLIISGDTAFQEDQWESIIGRGFSLAFHKKCLRCSMISIDQRSGLELTGVIKTLTRMTKRGFCFGTLFKNSPETSNAIIIVGTNVQIQMKQNN